MKKFQAASSCCPKLIVSGISDKLGQYDISYHVEGTKIKIIRSYERNSGRFPASDYKRIGTI
ncbi:hypothetical protein [Niabella aquatica]